MNTKNKRSKVKMVGFMCHSTTSTAICAPEDMRSVIVPRKANCNKSILIDNHGNNKYSHLVESERRLLAKANRSEIILPLAERSNRDHADQAHVFQVVVLRVSIHCQGCAGKVKKHLSRMEGVTSFSIDLETKRVTVMGHISPTGVLESVSKVKRAEFWGC